MSPLCAPRRWAVRLVVLAALLTPLLVTAPRASAQAALAVRINEFSAANVSGVADNTGDIVDWIELHNTSAAAVDLTGWSIADSSNSHTFAGESIPAGGFLVVFASGDETRTVAGEPHLPFKLNADGESLTLTNPQGTLSAPAWADPNEYPGQVSDVSYGVGAANALFYFDPPTPGAANGAGLGGVVEPVSFSVPAGFKTAAQTIVLDTPTAGATIRYTTDGSTPSATNGTAIAPGNSITVSSTTVLRAVAVRSGWVSSSSETRSYLFTADVIQQNATPPPGWPADNEINGQDMNYGMDPTVVVGNEALIQSSLLAIPTISIVTDLDNLFDPATGIYVNASGRGRTWERPASIELIDPSGAEPGFDINGGLRIRGGFSRSSANPKHSFRLFFRDEYEGDLDYALFGAEGVDRFEKVDLRTAQNFDWGWRHSNESTLIDEVWSRDTQAAMGQPYTRSRQYHLYLNGQYWGIHMTQERVSGEFGESYFGGDEDDYDVIKRGAPARTIEAGAGDLAAWESLYPLVSDGVVSDAEYALLDAQVDLENLADYYLQHFFTGDHDGAPSWYFSFDGNRWTASNNWYTMRNRNGVGEAGKWQFFDHDSEHSLCPPSGPLLRENIDNTTPWPLQAGVEYFSSAGLHQALITHPAYRQLFADRVQLHMIDPGGALTVAAGEARLDARIAEVSGAIDALSARWGDGPDSAQAVYGRTEWNNGLTRLRDCITDRQPVVQAQLQADGLWPVGEPPTIAPGDGALAWGDAITITAGGQPGVIWYTTDGSDPRDVDGTPSATATQYSGALSMTDDVTVRARVLDNGSWTPAAEATYTLSGPVGPPRLILNEYNAVADGDYLGGGGAADINRGVDSTLGRIPGNGGDWLELVVVEDNLDIRGWTVEVWNDSGAGLNRNTSLVFTNNPLLASLRAGTIITVSESLPDDVSYHPPSGDWTINLQANDAGDGAYFTGPSQRDFSIDNDDTRIAIVDELGRPEALRTGEQTAPAAGVNSTEVFKLEAPPSSAVVPGDAAYNDGTSSTWGLPNVFDAGAQVQDFTALRLDFGNTNCDAQTTVVDALFIAQYVVGNRSDANCPLPNPAANLHVLAGDVDNNGVTDIVDALFIVQCEVGITNPFCPS